MPCNMTRFTLKPSLPRHWRGQFSHLQQNKGQNTLPIWKMFQDVSRQNKLSGSCAILFGRSWFTSLVPTDSLQTLGNPQTPAWVRFGGLQPEHLSREEQNLQKPAVFGTDVHQVHGSIRIQSDCVMRPSPNIPNV